MADGEKMKGENAIKTQVFIFKASNLKPIF